MQELLTFTSVLAFGVLTKFPKNFWAVAVIAAILLMIAWKKKQKTKS